MINIFGLVVGIVVCLIIFLYINEEWSYDIFYVEFDFIYWVMIDEIEDDGVVWYLVNVYFFLVFLLVLIYFEIIEVCWYFLSNLFVKNLENNMIN